MAKTLGAPEKPSRCFMITPIGVRGSSIRKHADWVYRFIGDACDERNIELERADIMAGSPMITSRIFEAVRSADLCVADLTNLNANVFYELGIRHSLGLSVIHIAAEGTELPFDNAQHDTIFFDLTNIESMQQLTVAVGRQFDAIAAPNYVVSNPFTAALGAIQLQQSGDPKDQLLAKLEERIGILERGAGSPKARTIGRTDASHVLADLIAHHINTPAATATTRITLSPDFVRMAIETIPPWDSDEAQRIVNLLLVADAIDNRAEIIDEIRGRFPSVVPF